MSVKTCTVLIPNEQLLVWARYSVGIELELNISHEDHHIREWLQQKTKFYFDFMAFLIRGNVPPPLNWYQNTNLLERIPRLVLVDCLATWRIIYREILSCPRDKYWNCIWGWSAPSHPLTTSPLTYTSPPQYHLTIPHTMSRQRWCFIQMFKVYNSSVIKCFRNAWESLGATRWMNPTPFIMLGRYHP